MNCDCEQRVESIEKALERLWHQKTESDRDAARRLVRGGQTTSPTIPSYREETENIIAFRKEELSLRQQLLAVLEQHHAELTDAFRHFSGTDSPRGKKERLLRFFNCMLAKVPCEFQSDLISRTERYLRELEVHRERLATRANTTMPDQMSRVEEAIRARDFDAVEAIRCESREPSFPNATVPNLYVADRRRTLEYRIAALEHILAKADPH